MHVPPWDLVPGVDIPRWLWQEWALIVQAADANVQAYYRAQAQRDSAFRQKLGMS